MNQLHYLAIEDNRGIRELLLDAPTYSIGRSAKRDIRLFSMFVSPHHATLVQQSREDGSSCYRIIDGNLEGKPSITGISIEGHKLEAHNLENGDVVVLGPQVYLFYLTKEKGDESIGKCDFLFQCSKKWDGLRETSDSNIRYCSECQQEVYRIKSSDLKNRPATYKCFAVDFWWGSDVGTLIDPNAVAVDCEE
ncbi:FHA domain-containing protein [Trichocoleus sp. FACHB-262]|uniref:FHA domain-containing protein n=1 Tax=Trichocoleus sp. FACHB-262 TaxID=2692869 RepID=UPI0016863C47|nr:FHA domain-containing protein [Trichocoleus sp. FACHB-262]MBD2120307.1 FHA domain-containing protein [Trichocoleus sp. FACHB-262]